MFLGRNKKTRVNLTAAMIAVVRHVEQVLEVLTGEYVEFQHMPLVFGPIERVTLGGHRTILRRNVEVHGEGNLYDDSDRGFKFASSFVLEKGEDDCVYLRWEVAHTMDFELTFEGRDSEWYIAKWKYSNAFYPEVWVIEKFPKPMGRFTASMEQLVWKVGRDRKERREEPLFE